MTTMVVDPGKRIGVALFGDEGSELSREVVDWDGLVTRLTYSQAAYLEWWDIWLKQQWLIRSIVVENYRGRPGKARGGQEIEASEVIGALRILAEQSNVRFERQEPSILPIAIAWAGYRQTAQHLPDQDSAYLHGVYHFVKRGVLQPAPL